MTDLNANLSELAKEFCNWMEISDYTSITIYNHSLRLGYFLTWCKHQGIEKYIDVTRDVIEAYQCHLHHSKKDDGEFISARTQLGSLSVVRVFFKWLTEQKYILSNPASDIQLPRTPRTLNHQILSVQQIKKILAQPDTSKPLGIRDRAILETIYSTAITRSELANLTISDLDFEQELLKVRGPRERLIPLTEAAIDWLHEWLLVRQRRIKYLSIDTLFLATHGRALKPAFYSCMINKYMRAVGIEKEGSCLLFRHSVAALMIESGADLRGMQEFLGHRDLVSTQRYIKISLSEVKKIHSLTHPAKIHLDSSEEAAK